MPDMCFKQEMTLHLNGGSDFSELHYKITLDGREIATRHTRTNGSPYYKKTADEMHCGEKTFDILKTKGEGATAWLEDCAKEERKEECLSNRR